MIARGVNVGSQHLSLDPRTGRYNNWAKPLPKSAWNEIAQPHAVTVVHADTVRPRSRSGAQRTANFVIATSSSQKTIRSS